MSDRYYSAPGNRDGVDRRGSTSELPLSSSLTSRPSFQPRHTQSASVDLSQSLNRYSVPERGPEDATAIYRQSSRSGLLQGKWSQDLDQEYARDRSMSARNPRGNDDYDDDPGYERREWRSSLDTDDGDRNDQDDGSNSGGHTLPRRSARSSVHRRERRMSGTPDGLQASLRAHAMTQAAVTSSRRIDVEVTKPEGSPPLSSLGRRGSFSSDVSSHLSDADDDPNVALRRVLIRIIRKSVSIPLPTLKLKLYERKPHLRSSVRAAGGLRSYLDSLPETFDVDPSERVPIVRLAEGTHGKSLFAPSNPNEDDSAEHEDDAVDTSDEDGNRVHHRSPSTSYSRSPATSKESRHGRSVSPKGKGRASPSPSQAKPQPADPGSDRDVDHLIFVVHGIGGGLLGGARVEHHRQTIANNVRNVLKDSYPSVDMRLHFELVEWRSCLGEYTEDVDAQIKTLTLKGVKKMRDFANDIFLDAMYFMHNVYYHAIITEVTHQMNSAYDEFVATHPNFNGKVSVFAHSLGSVIMWDIIEPIDPSVFLGSHMDKPVTSSPKAKPGRRLNFDIETFFCTGSPLGVFLSLRRKHMGKDWVAPVGCKYFFNVFHPFDPVAYRIEGLISQELAKMDPEKCPTQGGVERSHTSKKSFWHKIGLGGGSKDEKTPSADILSGLPDRRFDFELQESFVEGVNEYLTAIRAHHCYWAHRDVALFVVKQLLSCSDEYFYLFDGHHN